eukprot:2532443-Rhodomonas_salina.1
MELLCSGWSQAKHRCCSKMCSSPRRYMPLLLSAHSCDSKSTSSGSNLNLHPQLPTICQGQGRKLRLPRVSFL